MKAAARLLLIFALVAPAFASAQTQAAPAPTCRLFASATIVNYNTKVHLLWDSRNATGGYLTDVGTIPPNGSAYVVPGNNTSYAASFTGPGGTIICRVAVAVRQGGAGSSYGGGIINVDGTSNFQGSSIDTAGAPITPISGVNTNNQSINSNNTINTTNNPIDTGKPVNTNVPVNLDRTVNLGGNVTLPVVPSVAPSAATPGSNSGLIGGIVPAECRGANTVANCDLCSLAQLGQNVGNFLLGVTIPAAALLFAWAGILYFSARGNPGQIEKAHKVFRSVVIGFVIAVCAWVLVITVMNMLIHGKDFSGWNWKTLSCSDTRKARLYNMDLGTYLKTSLPALQATNGNGSAFGDSCPQGGTLSVTETGNYCITSSGGAYAAVGNSNTTANDARQDQLQDDCDSGDQASCAQLNVSISGTTMSSANYSSEQNVWLSACRQGDAASCQSFSASTGSGELGARITAAVEAYKGTDTSMGPDGGNKACAWAVNNILTSAGIAPIGGNTVESVERTLQNGRGTAVSTANAVPGDIVIWKDYSGTASHVGICQDAGCSSAISNSSRNATFTTVSGPNYIGQVGRVYHVNN